MLIPASVLRARPRAGFASSPLHDLAGFDDIKSAFAHLDVLILFAPPPAALPRQCRVLRERWPQRHYPKAPRCEKVQHKAEEDKPGTVEVHRSQHEEASHQRARTELGHGRALRSSLALGVAIFSSGASFRVITRNINHSSGKGTGIWRIVAVLVVAQNFICKTRQTPVR